MTHKAEVQSNMRIAVFGATGMAGGAIVNEALAREHGVVAVSRHPDTSVASDRLTTRALDVSDTDTLASILTEVDAAVLTIRLAPGQEHRLAPLTRGFLDTASRTRTQVLIVGGSSPLHSPDNAGTLVIETDYVPDQYRAIAQASLDQYRICQGHPHAGWVYLSPPAILEPGARTGRYRRGTTTLLVDEHGDSRITASDLAVAVIDELENPSGERHLTVASAGAA